MEKIINDAWENRSEINSNSDKKIIDIDGVRVMNKDGWWLVRASNTQPALVIRCESSSRAGLENQKKNVVEQLNKVDSSFNQKISNFKKITLGAMTQHKILQQENKICLQQLFDVFKLLVHVLFRYLKS